MKLSKFKKITFIKGFVFLIISNIGFSSKAILIKLLHLHNVDSISIVGMRMLFSLPFFIISSIWISYKSNNKKIKSKDLKLIIILGFLSYYISSTLDFLGLEFISASIERLILFTYPTMVLLISLIVLKKKINNYQYIALILTYIGIAITLLSENTNNNQKNIFIGAILVFSSALTYSIYVVGAGEMLKKVGSFKFISYAMVSASIPVIIQSWFYNKLNFFNYSFDVYILISFLVVFSTIIPLILLTEGIRLVGSTNSSLIGFIGPISTIYLAYIFLDEKITLLQMIGTLIVVLGIYFISIKKN